MNILKKKLAVTSILFVILSFGLAVLLIISNLHTRELEDRIHAMESQLSNQTQIKPEPHQMAGPGAASSQVDRMLKDLSTRFVGDTRSIAEKLRDFLKENADTQRLAVACKLVADLADNREALSNQELNWLYQQETKPEFKRVVAQVLSQRGDNKLLDSYVAQYQSALGSNNSEEHRNALRELAKTRYAGAAKLIVPSLQDKDPSLLQEAMLALKATGNESNIQKLKPLVNSPDSAVSWLATDVLNALEMLSKKARIHLASADVVAELPPIIEQQ